MKTTKSIYLAALLLFASATAFAQIGVDNTSPDPSSVLDLAASDKGVLIPRMTTVQRLAIPSPGASLLVFDTTEGKFYFYTGTQWATLNSFDQNSGSTTAVHNGNVVINGTLTASSFGGINVSGVVPPGGIIMWSGAVANIPTGWALCNGANGTPDLRNRFIIGAGSTYSVNNTGGRTNLKLTAEQVPIRSHSHAATVNDPGHVHAARRGTSSNIGSFFAEDTGTAQGSKNTSSATTGISVTIASNLAVEASQLVDIMPPYWALAYIMKLP